MDLLLTEVKIKNLLSYKKAKFTWLKAFNVLIGKNNAGKSNLFKILRIMQKSFQCYRFSQKILFNDNPEIQGQISLTFKFSDEFLKSLLSKMQSNNKFLDTLRETLDIPKLDENGIINYIIKNKYYNSVKIKLAYLNDYPNIFLLQGFYLIHKENTSQCIFELRKEEGKYSIYVLRQSISDFENLMSMDDYIEYGEFKRVAQEYPNTDLGNFVRGSHYGNIYLSTFLPEIANLFRESLFFIPDNRYFQESLETSGADRETLEEDGSNFVRYIFKQENNPEGKIWMEQLNLELQKFFPDLRVLSQKFKTSQTEVYYQENDLNIDIEKENMGAAILHISFFLAFLKNLSPNSILLVEEPELFIFPGLQNKLRNKFIEKSNEIQFFITTHSREFLPETSEQSSIYSIKKEINQTKVYYVPEEKYSDIYEDLDINIEVYEQQKSLLYNEPFWEKFIEKAIVKTEDQLWDFKETLEIWKVEKSKREEFKIKFSERVAAFANESGGIIFIGISNNLPRKIVGIDGIEDKINEISETLMKWGSSKIKFFEVRELVLKDEDGNQRKIIILSIKQTKEPIGVIHSDGRYSYPIRSGPRTINSSYPAIMKAKKDIHTENFNYFYSIQEFYKKE